MEINEYLLKTVEMGASDLHIAVGIPPTVRSKGKMVRLTDVNLSPEDTENFVKSITSEEQFRKLINNGELDFSISYRGFHRFRVNAFRQRGSYSIAIRSIFSQIPAYDSLGLPSIIKKFTMLQRGLVLVTGPTGSGKSTTLAALIDEINKTRECHIITLEDPIEYLHRHGKSIVNQREIGTDSESFSTALRASLRQDPDVILIGEMRDLETISIALTAAETGHLVFSTLHTVGAAKTVDRIIDVFPPHQQAQIRTQLSMVCQGVISQQLIKKKDGSGRVPAMEIMVANPAIRNLVREGKTHQIQNIIQTGSRLGMKSMDADLVDLYRAGMISQEDAISYSVDQDTVVRTISGGAPGGTGRF